MRLWRLLRRIFRRPRPFCPACGGSRCVRIHATRVPGGQILTRPSGERLFIPDPVPGGPRKDVD